ncbi:MAG: helix-turn-helix transcriptional regulator [Bacteroidales bacterium]|nr:helix-turn-helix transcriptional regulator [Bacteroidales bacterium]MBD5172496.1 helix-turn-helix transcriptional regulator [Bacteroidales bacterium]
MITEKKKGYTPETRMREMIRDNAMLLPAISRFNIAFGFGDNDIRSVCKENDVDMPTFLCVCNLLSGYEYDLSTVSLESLMGYLKRAHTSFLDVELPKIRHYLIDSLNYSSNELSLLLMRFYDDYVQEVRRHMEHENEVIFSYVSDLLAGHPHDDFKISTYSESHQDTVEKLNELKDIFIYHYKQKDNSRLSGALLDIIICERDMLSHFEVESRLLIPLVEQLEQSLDRTNRMPSRAETDRPDEQPAFSPASLSEREKDIVRCIARGKVNKEIADELCISVHTVATHRRNISAKLDIHTSAGLVIYAIINHLVDISDVTPI